MKANENPLDQILERLKQMRSSDSSTRPLRKTLRDLFSHLKATKGAAWTHQFKSVSAAELMRIWSDDLPEEYFPDEIIMLVGRRIGQTSGHPPNIGEFREMCDKEIIAQLNIPTKEEIYQMIARTEWNHEIAYFCVKGWTYQAKTCTTKELKDRIDEYYPLAVDKMLRGEDLFKKMESAKWIAGQAGKRKPKEEDKVSVKATRASGNAHMQKIKDMLKR